MSTPHVGVRIAMACTVVALLQITALPALAESSHEQRHERPYCVVFIEPLALGQAASTVRDLRCFRSYAEGVTYATGGRLRLAANASPKQLTEAQLNAATGSSLIGRDYEDPNYDCNIFGPCLDWWVDNDFGCTGGRNYVATSMPSGWNDQVSSTKAFTGCSRNQNFENTNYGGALLTCLPNCATMGVMNDATSSKQWRDV
jgi:hypothetical protein